MKKKTKREQVYEILDSQGYILDNQTAKIFGENWTTVAEYTRAWKRLHADKALKNGYIGKLEGIVYGMPPKP